MLQQVWRHLTITAEFDMMLFQLAKKVLIIN